MKFPVCPTLMLALVTVVTAGCNSKDLTRDKARSLILDTVPPKKEWLISPEIFAAGQKAGLWSTECEFPEPGQKQPSWVELKPGDSQQGCQFQSNGVLSCSGKAFLLNHPAEPLTEDPTQSVTRLYLSPVSPSGRWMLIHVCVNDTCARGGILADLSAGTSQVVTALGGRYEGPYHWIDWDPKEQYALLATEEEGFAEFKRLELPATPEVRGTWKSKVEGTGVTLEVNRRSVDLSLAADGRLVLDSGAKNAMKDYYIRIPSPDAKPPQGFAGTWECWSGSGCREIATIVLNDDGSASVAPVAAVTFMESKNRDDEFERLHVFYDTAQRDTANPDVVNIVAQSAAAQGQKLMIQLDLKNHVRRKVCPLRKVTDLGKKYVARVEQFGSSEPATAQGGFDWKQFGANIAGQPYNEWGKVVLIDPVEVDAEITGITTPPIGGQESLKQVEFTWRFKNLPDPLAAIIGPLLSGTRVMGAGAGTVPGKGRAEMQLYDDGWRIQHIEGIRYLPGKDESFQIAG